MQLRRLRLPEALLISEAQMRTPVLIARAFSLCFPYRAYGRRSSHSASLSHMDMVDD
jgi:hypothetical protein